MKREYLLNSMFIFKKGSNYHPQEITVNVMGAYGCMVMMDIFRILMLSNFIMNKLMWHDGEGKNNQQPPATKPFYGRMTCLHIIHSEIQRYRMLR